jgi:hypothetical protein
MRSASGEAGRGPVVRRGLLLFAALAAAGGCGGATPAAHDGAAPVASPALRLTADYAARPVSSRRLGRHDWSGDRFALAGGDAVTVHVSDAYSDDADAARRWADYLGSLVHGEELNLLEAYVATPDEVRELCRAEALGCYGSDTMISIGETVDGVTPEEVVAHEYGHHVAHNRANPPWPAIDYGTKRWATHAGICARADAAEIFPGDQGIRYRLNPGEGFAEVYRALVESKRGAGTFTWSLVDRSFYPDAEALARVEADVLRPWSRSQPVTRRVSVPAGARVWTTRVATPLDGELEVTVRLRAGVAGKLAVLEGGTGRVAARGLWSSATEQHASVRVCGVRSVSVRVIAPRGTRFALGLSTP